MKQIWKRKDGVSPVIATILMVAITVVLAAVLYVMVSGYMSGGGDTLLAGSFSNDGSTPSTGEATMKLSITTPSEPKMVNIELKMFDTSDTEVTNGTFSWVHVASDSADDFVTTGDKLKYTAAAAFDIDGWTVSMTVDDYDGTIEFEI